MDETLARVATALLLDYASVYYINIITGQYHSYSVNQGYQKLDLQLSGEDFFSDLARDIQQVVWDEDRPLIIEGLKRESLMEKLKTANTLSFVYRLIIDGKPVYHTLRILRDLSGEEGTLILGVLNVDEQVRREKAVKTYNDIANSLADRYTTIYYVDTATDHYMEYSSTNDYRDLAIPTEGLDFFTESRNNITRVVHPEDQEKVLFALQKDTMMEKTLNEKRFTLEYRLIMNSQSHYVRLIAVRSRNQDHLIVALDMIDAEIKQQEDLRAISERSIIFSQIAESLASQYGMIYYIDAETDEYVEFSSTDDYKDLNIAPIGSDFFGTSQRNISMIVAPNDRQRVFNALNKKTMLAALHEKGTFTMTYQLQLKRGGSYTRMAVFWANDRKHLIMPIMNIDNEIQRENVLKKMIEENTVFSQIAESLANQYDTIYYVDMLTDHYVEFASTDVYKSLEVQPSGDDFFAESLKNMNRVIFPDDRDEFMRILNKNTLIQSLHNKHNLTHTYRLMLNNDIVYARMSIIWATDNKHLIIGVMNIDQEVRREKEVQEKLVAANEKAYRDALTGVKNKAAFTEYIEQLQEGLDTNSITAFACLVCDVNCLKEVNDSMGHIEGDAYIKGACLLICRSWSHSPVFRIGGDEFCVIIQGDDYINRERLFVAMRESIEQNRQMGKVTIASGISDFLPSSDTKVMEVFNRADTLMYENKALMKGI